MLTLLHTVISFVFFFCQIITFTFTLLHNNKTKYWLPTYYFLTWNFGHIKFSVSLLKKFLMLLEINWTQAKKFPYWVVFLFFGTLACSWDAKSQGGLHNSMIAFQKCFNLRRANKICHWKPKNMTINYYYFDSLLMWW